MASSPDVHSFFRPFHFELCRRSSELFKHLVSRCYHVITVETGAREMFNWRRPQAVTTDLGDPILVFVNGDCVSHPFWLTQVVSLIGKPHRAWNVSAQV